MVWAESVPTINDAARAARMVSFIFFGKSSLFVIKLMKSAAKILPIFLINKENGGKLKTPVRFLTFRLVLIPCVSSA